MKENNREDKKLLRTKKLELLRTFLITIGWLCEPFIRAWRAYVRHIKKT